MSSTYSTNLQLELIGTGDQAGTWGTTTNNNLGTLIEQAISGYVTQAITDGADTVLVMTPGASATPRNMFIECTGALTGSRNLIVPGTSPNANKKLYFIYNNTTGGNAVTVKVAGQTGVSVPNGVKMALVCNGTDIVQAVNYMASPTFSSPVMTGTPVAPTATPGTNTTQVATTAFVAAAATPLATILQAVYPVGSIYVNASNGTNPATLLGFGTWVAFGGGQVPVGFSSGDPLFGTAGNTGGSRDAIVVNHTHTASSSSSVSDPGHSHIYYLKTGNGYRPSAAGNENNGYDANTSVAFTGISVSTSTTINPAGSSGTNGNLQPYITVYMWCRTA